MRAYQGIVPGAGVVVLREAIPIFRKTYGLADLENRIAATAATNYRLASVTKQFTAAAILLLAEAGCLSVDDPVRRWLPSLPPAANAAVVRHLLTHTSGLIDFEDLIARGAFLQLHDADVLRLLEAENRSYFSAGADYRYSNSGYALLALIVERASGQGFAAFLRDRIFLPVGMHNTIAFEAGGAAVAHRAFGYTARRQSWLRTDQDLTSATLGDGGIYSSIDDLAKWEAALCDDRLLRPASLRLAFRPATRTDAPDVEYGFGWRVTRESVWHSGETIGFRNVIVRYREHPLTVVVLTNRNDPPPYPIALAIARAFMPAC